MLFFQELFGPSVLNRTMVILSHADAVFKEKSIDRYLAEEAKQSDSHLYNFIVREAGRRVVAISNLTQDWPPYKVDQQRCTILNCLMQMVKDSDNEAYTNDTFVDAQELKSNARRNFLEEKKELLGRTQLLLNGESSLKIKGLDSGLTATERKEAIERIKASSKSLRDLNTEIISTIFEVLESTVERWIENGEVSVEDYLLLQSNRLSKKLKKKVDKVIRTLSDREQEYYKAHESAIKKALVKYVLENEDSLRRLVEKNKKLLRICFPADSTVLVEGRGLTRMDALEVGDRVLTAGDDGTVRFEDIFFFSHRDRHTTSVFLLVRTETGEQITLSPLHLIPVNINGCPMFTLIPARELRPGDTVFIAQTKTHTPSLGIAKVSSITMVVREGLYCPHTSSGSVFVDNILSSCYTTVVPARLAHALLRPVYWLYQWLPTRCFNWLVCYDEVTGYPGVLTHVRKLFI